MELKLVRIRYCFKKDKTEEMPRSMCVLLSGDATIESVHEWLEEIVFPNQLHKIRTDYVPFHQEDAFALGLKIGDVL